MFMNGLLNVYTLFTVTLIFYVHGQTYDAVTDLKKDLQDGYDKTVRPIQNQSSAITVTVSLLLHSILGVNTAKGTMTLTISLVCKWQDERLIWQPSNYENVNSLLVKQGVVWTPAMTLASPVEFKVLGKEWMHVHFYSDGNASWEPGDIVENACSYNLKYWPFDKQICDVYFLVYDHFQSEVNLQAGKFINAFMYDNNEWFLERTSTQNVLYGRSPEIFSAVKFRLQIARHASFYIITIILPLLAIGALNAMVFLLPSESGERVGYSITILLSNAVFLTVLSQYLPMASDPLPLVCIMITMSLVLSFLTMLLVIVSLSLYHRDDNNKRGVAWFADVVFSKVLPCLRKKNKIESTENERANTIGTNKEEVVELNAKELDKIKRFSDLTLDTDEKLSGKELSYVMDYIFFIILSFVHTISSGTLVVYLVVTSDYVEPGRAATI